MRARRAVCAALAAALLCLASPASAAGTASDSLVTRSAAEDWGGALLDEAAGGLGAALGEALTGPGARIYDLDGGDAVVLREGASVLLLSGGARVSASGTLVNVTLGLPAGSGGLNPAQLYVVGGDSSARVTARDSARAAVWGGAELQRGEVVFADVPVGTWYYDYVYAAVAAGVIDGMNSYEFAPESGFTAAQAVKIAACLHQLYHEGSVSLENDPELWYRSYIEYAVANGVAESRYAEMGVDELNSPIDRRNFAVLFYNAMPAYEYAPINDVAGVADVAAGSYGAEEILALYRAGVLTGINAEGDFWPDSGIRRNEAAAIVARMLDESLRVKL